MSGFKVSPDVITSIARHLHVNGFRYCESVTIKAWKSNEWPERKCVFQAVDALLLAYREIDNCCNFSAGYSLEVVHDPK